MKLLNTKWLWRFAIKEDALWKNLIMVKYGFGNFVWLSKISAYAHGVGCWKLIMADLSVVHFEMKNGSKVSFWHGIWQVVNLLKFTF